MSSYKKNCESLNYPSTLRTRQVCKQANYWSQVQLDRKANKDTGKDELKENLRNKMITIMVAN